MEYNCKGQAFRQGATAYGRPQPCRGLYLSAEEIDRERRESGWNPYAGEEERTVDMGTTGGEEPRTGMTDPNMRLGNMSGEAVSQTGPYADREALNWANPRMARETMSQMEPHAGRGAVGEPDPNAGRKETMNWSEAYRNGGAMGQSEQNMDDREAGNWSEANGSGGAMSQLGMDAGSGPIGWPEPNRGMGTMDQARRNAGGEAMRQPGPQPYMCRRDMAQVLEEEELLEQDLRKLQGMYPETAQILLPHIEEECDKLEYEGSMMFDERPDLETIRQISTRIQRQVQDQFPPIEEEERDEALSMQAVDRRRRPGKNWLGDFIRTMLVEEMHRRRCRHHRCRRSNLLT